MVACVHVARILPGRQEEFARQLKESFEAGREALKAFGFTRIVSFTTAEASADGEALLVTVYEADDPSVVERFYTLEPVIEQERRGAGGLVAPHRPPPRPTKIAVVGISL